MSKSIARAFLLIGICSGLLVCNCDSYNEQPKIGSRSQENTLAKRRAYVQDHLEGIQQANKEFCQKKILESILVSYSAFLEDQPQKDRKLLVKYRKSVEMFMKMVIYNEDPNIAGTKIFAAMYKQEPQLTSKERDEFVGIIAALVNYMERGLQDVYNKPDNDLFDLFKFAILRGCIIEGMTVGQVKIAWNEYDLSFQYSDTLGYEGYEAKCIRQKVKRIDNENWCTFITIPNNDENDSEKEPLCKDFHLIFKNGKLENLISFSDKNELSQRLIEFMKERSERETTQKEIKAEDGLSFSDKDEFARALNMLREVVIGNVKGKHEEVDKIRIEQDQKTAREYKKKGTVKSDWKEVARWQGSGMKSTDTFHVSSDTWRISWEIWSTEYSAPLFQIYVFKSTDKLGEDVPVSIAANVMANEDSSSSTIRGSGDFYLVINTLLSYIVTIEEKV